jgi:DNA repair exonuclease SbcCD ATPase subunit
MVKHAVGNRSSFTPIKKLKERQKTLRRNKKILAELSSCLENEIQSIKNDSKKSKVEKKLFEDLDTLYKTGETESCVTRTELKNVKSKQRTLDVRVSRLDRKMNNLKRRMTSYKTILSKLEQQVNDSVKELRDVRESTIQITLKKHFMSNTQLEQTSSGGHSLTSPFCVVTAKPSILVAKQKRTPTHAVLKPTKNISKNNLPATLNPADKEDESYPDYRNIPW